MNYIQATPLILLSSLSPLTILAHASSGDAYGEGLRNNWFRFNVERLICSSIIFTVINTLMAKESLGLA